jgi:hypothetical protein
MTHPSVAPFPAGLLVVLVLLPLGDQRIFAAADDAEPIPCISQGAQGICIFPQTLVDICAQLSSASVFAQCNIYALPIGSATPKQDDHGRSYLSAIFKYSERNDCHTGGNSLIPLLGKCDTFAAYAQLLRDMETNKCYALVNSALLGAQREEDTVRNNPNKVVQKLEIPGVSRRITFTPARRAPLLEQASSPLLRTPDPQRPFVRSGPAISALSLLELESTLTVNPENLKPNPAKIRITRGVGSRSDFLDIPLGSREEASLNQVLSGCQ